MNVLKRLLNFYLQSSIHVALSVVSLTIITLLEFNIPYTVSLFYFVFFASVTGYNFVKYFGVAKFHHISLTKWLKGIQVFSFFSFLAMCFFALHLSAKTVCFILGLGLVTFLYAIPFLPKHFFLDSKQNLRSIGGLKIYLIGVVWSGVTVILPIIESKFSFSTDVFITAIQRFVFIIALMLPFEIRDLSYDSLKLSTVPQKIGVKFTKVLGLLLLIVFFLLEFFKDDINVLFTIVLFFVSLITFLLILLSKVKQNKYYSSFWVESVPIFWLLILLVFR